MKFLELRFPHNTFPVEAVFPHLCAERFGSFSPFILGRNYRQVLVAENGIACSDNLAIHHNRS